MADLFAACVRPRLSIVFAGPPGSGKTTLRFRATAALDPSLRVVPAVTDTCPRCDAVSFNG